MLHTLPSPHSPFTTDGGTFINVADKDFAVRVWGVESGRLAHALSGHSQSVWGVAFSPDGTRVVTSGWDDTVRCWDAATGRQLHSFAGPGGNVPFLAGGRRVAYGRGREVYVPDASDGTEYPSLIGHDKVVATVAASADGSRVMSGGNDGLAILWDAATGGKLCELRGHTEGVTGVAFSGDGRSAITGSSDKTVRLWRLPK